MKWRNSVLARGVVLLVLFGAAGPAGAGELYRVVASPGAGVGSEAAPRCTASPSTAGPWRMPSCCCRCPDAPPFIARLEKIEWRRAGRPHLARLHRRRAIGWCSPAKRGFLAGLIYAGRRDATRSCRWRTAARAWPGSTSAASCRASQPIPPSGDAGPAGPGAARRLGGDPANDIDLLDRTPRRPATRPAAPPRSRRPPRPRSTWPTPPSSTARWSPTSTWSATAPLHPQRFRRRWAPTSPGRAPTRRPPRCATRLAADMVSLMVEAGSACGLGYVMRSRPAPAFAGSAFQVTALGCAVGNLSFAHEHGHNMGMEHDPANGTSPASASFPYAFGHFVNGSYRTVMSYAGECSSGCTRVPHFSNPIDQPRRPADRHRQPARQRPRGQRHRRDRGQFPQRSGRPQRDLPGRFRNRRHHRLVERPPVTRAATRR